jgi:glyoxylate/hydroxypyruvate reductase A
MSIALVITDRSTDLLAQSLKALQPDLSIQVWPNIKNPESVELAVLWQQPPGILQQFSNLKAVTSFGAGIDFILIDPGLPKSIPVLRIVTKDLKQQMSQYVLAHLLSDYRKLNVYKKQQSQSNWRVHELPKQTTIGFLGLGEIGQFVAKQCQDLGFKVIAYTQQSTYGDVTYFHGEEGFKNVMQNSNYVVCLLPLSVETIGILDYKAFSYCQKQPMLIQAGRGQQLSEMDLLKALDEGLLKHAVLDVFNTEPLPNNHEFWDRKDITLTPHNAARSDVEQTAKEILCHYHHILNE